MNDGEPLGKMLPGDIDAVVERLQAFKNVVTKGLGDRMGEVHAGSPAP